MFAKLVGKVKTVGQHDVGSLDMFLLSDSDSDDDALGEAPDTKSHSMSNTTINTIPETSPSPP